MIRAVNLDDGQLASDVLTLSYIVNENHTLPVVSLVTDEENLFGPRGSTPTTRRPGSRTGSGR